MSALFDALASIPFAALMLVVTLGFLLGRLEWRRMSLGPAGGTLLVAVLLGSLGLSLSPVEGVTGFTLGGFGFALFIYSVGFDAGPRFFAGSGGGQGWRFLAVGALVNLVAFAIALLGGRWLALDGSLVAGLLAGALTSPPTYAAASEVASDTAALAVTFAVTYPLGLVGVVLLVQFLPRAMGDDLVADTEEDREDQGGPTTAELRRVFEVRRPDVIGSTLAQLEITRRTGCVITYLHRDVSFEVPGPDTLLIEGDRVMAKGRLDDLQRFSELIGPEVYDEELRRGLPSPRSIQVTSRRAVGKSLRELDLVRRFGVLVTEVARGEVALDPGADLLLLRDDVVRVAGPRTAVRAAAETIGRFERSTQETDIAVYAGGILLGLLLGRLHLRAPGIDFELGSAVGLLTVGVLLGRFRRIGPLRAHVPQAARQLVRDLGILLFIAETGVAAGATPIAGLHSALGPVLLLGAVTCVVPVSLAAIVGRRLLALRPADLWGSIGGGMTSSSALAAVRTAADSNEPALSYATSYALSSVLATLAGRAVILLM